MKPTFKDVKILLESLEWSGSKEGPSMSMGGQGVTVTCCPSCKGVNPQDKWAGAYNKDGLGHDHFCDLKGILDRCS